MAAPTGGTNRWVYEAPSEFKEYPVDYTKLTTAILAGDRVYYDEVQNILISAADFPWQGSLAATQRAFAFADVGISMDYVPLTANPAGTFLTNVKARVAKLGVGRVPIASATWKENALFTLAKNASTNFLDPAKYIVTTDPTLAIAKAMVNSNGQIIAGETIGSVAATSALVEWEARRVSSAMINREFFIIDAATVAAIPLPPTSNFALAAKIGSAGVESQTLANGYPGQEFWFTADSVGTGTREITFSQAFDGSGAHTKCKITALNQAALFKCGGDGKWLLIVNRETTLS